MGRSKEEEGKERGRDGIGRERRKEEYIKCQGGEEEKTGRGRRERDVAPSILYGKGVCVYDICGLFRPLLLAYARGDNVIGIAGDEMARGKGNVHRRGAWEGQQHII